MILRSLILCWLMFAPVFAQTARDTLWRRGTEEMDTDELPDAQRVMQAVRDQLPYMPLNLHGFIRTPPAAVAAGSAIAYGIALRRCGADGTLHLVGRLW